MSPRPPSKERLLHRGSRTAVFLVEEGGERWIRKELLTFADVAPERVLLAREARLHSVCAGPGIVPLRDRVEEERVGQLAQCSSFCRHYVHGFSLRQHFLFPKAHPLPHIISSPQAVILALATTLGLLAAKKDQFGRPLRIVHRDVTPGNVLIDQRGFVWLNDFGLTHLAAREKLDEEECSQGSFAYLSPEQRRGNELGPSSDVFQCALLLFLLEQASHDQTAQHKHARGKDLVRKAHRFLDDRYGCSTLSACLDRDPRNRPDAETLRNALSQKLAPGQQRFSRSQSHPKGA